MVTLDGNGIARYIEKRRQEVGDTISVLGINPVLVDRGRGREENH